MNRLGQVNPFQLIRAVAGRGLFKFGAIFNDELRNNLMQSFMFAARILKGAKKIILIFKPPEAF
ncbi:hypothetical protein [Chryseobacterium hagamense]|uniref:Uncharacterized protein n=1 Tax=Chryseobacterium hagamense TaxID=395935 RepID=A0A511YGK7_9FLAO|nr:hypothetical protein [Chryseobacterium hagamense]GEN74296.1 hypothetical protein CHA01nite_00360 [Chryseobacterium hagamense]